MLFFSLFLWLFFITTVWLCRCIRLNCSRKCVQSIEAHKFVKIKWGEKKTSKPETAKITKNKPCRESWTWRGRQREWEPERESSTTERKFSIKLCGFLLHRLSLPVCMVFNFDSAQSICICTVWSLTWVALWPIHLHCEQLHSRKAAFHSCATWMFGWLQETLTRPHRTAAARHSTHNHNDTMSNGGKYMYVKVRKCEFDMTKRNIQHTKHFFSMRYMCDVSRLSYHVGRIVPLCCILCRHSQRYKYNVKWIGFVGEDGSSSGVYEVIISIVRRI